MGKNFYLMSGSAKEVMDTTNNDSVYRKARKRWLETSEGCLHCSYCRYHKGENRTTYYGGYIEEGESFKDAKIKYPPWKLASKNRKQWMAKNYVNIEAEKKVTHWGSRRGEEYEWINFHIGKEKGIKFAKFYKR